MNALIPFFSSAPSAVAPVGPCAAPSGAGDHLLERIADCGSLCELCLSVERVCLSRGDLLGAAEAAEGAESWASKAFALARGEAA